MPRDSGPGIGPVTLDRRAFRCHDTTMEWWENDDFREGVPFAVDTAGEWRDVDDVPNGKKCGCICGACHGPLVAKQGEVRAHHFAHDDRHECRNALEASLFGMAINLLLEPGAVLAMPAFGDRRQLAIKAGIPSTKLGRVSSGDLIVPQQRLSMEGAMFNAKSLAESSEEKPDIFLPGPQIAIHFLSINKNVHQAEKALAGPSVSILGLNLRSYAQLWWQVCDARKEQRIKAATQARELMRKWLQEYLTGRGWMNHRDVRAEKLRLEGLARDYRQAGPEPEPPFSIPLGAKLVDRDPRWILPKKESHPQPGALGWVATGAGLVPATPQFMKAIRAEWRAEIDSPRATEIGLKWHSRLNTWVFVGMAEDTVPIGVRSFLAPTSPWMPVLRDDRDFLKNSAPTSSPPASRPKDVHPPPEPEQPPPPRSDEILVADVGTCFCGKPLNEVRIANGYFQGRRARTCSSGQRHPFKLLD